MSKTPTTRRRLGGTTAGAAIGVALALGGGALAVDQVLGAAPTGPDADVTPEVVTEYVDADGEPIPAPASDPEPIVEVVQVDPTDGDTVETSIESAGTEYEDDEYEEEEYEEEDGEGYEDEDEDDDDD